MTIRICGLALAAFAAWGLGAASAQESAAEPGLTLGQFLEDAARNHPRLEEARAELDAAEARGRANSRPLYNAEFEGEFSDTVSFTRSGVNGELIVAADHFDLHARLGFLLGAFAKTIENEVLANLDTLLAKSEAGVSAAKSAAKPAAKKARK